MASNEPPREPIDKSSVDKELNKAINKQEGKQGASEAGQHAKHVAGKAKPNERPKSDSEKEKEKNNILKVVGGVVAVVAAVAVGTTIVKKSRSEKEEQPSGDGSFLDGANKSLKSTQRWFGEKAEHAKDKAGEISDDVGPRIKGAANSTKDKVNDAIPSSVSNTAANIKDRASVAGIKVEREGLKASESSDAAVRDAADKILHKSGRAADKADAKSGGFFGNVKGWFIDRKDDIEDASESISNKWEETVKGDK